MESQPVALVVDASVATKWHLADEDHVNEAMLLLRHLAHRQVDLHAPDFIQCEVPSAIAVATHSGKRISEELGRMAIEKFLALPLQTHNSGDLVLSAYSMVHQHGCALYDALYLALAERLGLRFITADQKLYQRVRHLPYVLWIGDYRPPENA